MLLWDACDVRKIAFGQINPLAPADTAKQVGFLCKIDENRLIAYWSEEPVPAGFEFLSTVQFGQNFK